ncbi:hypothetical protein J6590_107868, partial [Homalodisca vitripennis]
MLQYESGARPVVLSALPLTHSDPTRAIEGEAQHLTAVQRAGEIFLPILIMHRRHYSSYYLVLPSPVQ